jgi:hypothetical protein
LLLESPSGNLSQFMRLDENGLKSASAGQAHWMLKKNGIICYFAIMDLKN